MSKAFSADPIFWRQHAEEARRTAGAEADPEQKAKWLEIARLAEALASRLEAAENAE